MKKLFILMLTVVTMLSAVSCRQSKDKISQNQIVKQFNKQLKNSAQDLNYAEIQVGVYECNDPEYRLLLRKMEAAGLVTYDVTRYAWWEKTSSTYKQSYDVPEYFFGYYLGSTTHYRTVSTPVYNFEDHYIVKVGLTDAGRKCVLTELPEAVPAKDKDMEQPEIDESEYAWNKVNLEETWPEIDNPFLPAKPKTETAANADSGKDDSTSTTQDNSASQPDHTERKEAAQYEAYKAVVQNSETVYVKTYTAKAFKARNIRIKTEDGYTVAEAEVLVKTTGVTDFGRILSAVENNMKQLTAVVMNYFEDKGWVLSEDVIGDDIEPEEEPIDEEY